jgi:hypothetical protein
MTVPRGSTLTLLLLVAASCALFGAAACTTGVTPVCDDAGTCLISEPPDGSVVGEGAARSDAGDAGAGEGAAPTEAGPEAAPEAAPESGMDAADG